MAATATITKVSAISSSTSDLRRPNPTGRAIIGSKRSTVGVGVSSIPLPTTSFIRLTSVRASKPQKEEINSNADDTDRAFILSQEDWKYLVQLGGGSVVGGAAIKYGSVLFPQITKPNIFIALIMISAPVVVAVWLLIKQSHLDSKA
ncbi:unnamed protein product [Ilex paraguariensis]|uniref:Uncharacterized protein n=1 Tax=Ilex paraguariensis TaxID=185542 RepID=A0ABC8T9W7_9AQUA